MSKCFKKHHILYPLSSALTLAAVRFRLPLLGRSFTFQIIWIGIIITNQIFLVKAVALLIMCNAVYNSLQPKLSKLMHF